jgi:hypothetical protein
MRQGTVRAPVVPRFVWLHLGEVLVGSKYEVLGELLAARTESTWLISRLLADLVWVQE